MDGLSFFSVYEIKFFEKHYEVNDFDWYLEQLPLTLIDEMTFEKSPSYFPSLVVPKRVKQFDPNLKFLVTIREPVKRCDPNCPCKGYKFCLDVKTLPDLFQTFCR